MGNDCIRCGYCCKEVEIKVADLLFPEVFLDAKGLEFYKIRGFENLVKTNSMIRMTMRCPNLEGDDICLLHDKDKPEYCQKWDCHRNLRDEEWFINRMSEFAMRTISDIENIVNSMIPSDVPIASDDPRLKLLSLIQQYNVKKRTLEGEINNG